MGKLFRSKLYLAIFLMTAVLIVGVFGYRFISDFGWLDALYMTIITVTTVGFSEVKTLEPEGKIFTLMLIVSSVFIVGFAISVITEYILGRNSMQLLKKKKVKQKIDKLSGHVVICGYGRNGSQAVERLKAYNQPFVVIENNKEVIEKYEDEVLFVEGDASEDDILIEAGIARAKYLITALPIDSANLFIVLSARQLNKKLYIISRASLIPSQKKLMLAGANTVIMPDKIGGDHMASLVVMPDLITFMDKLSTEGENTTNLEEVPIENFVSGQNCKSLRDLDLRRKTGCTIIGYVDPNGKYIINPDAELQLEAEGKVIVLGRPEQIKKLNEMYHLD